MLGDASELLLLRLMLLYLLVMLLVLVIGFRAVQGHSHRDRDRHIRILVDKLGRRWVAGKYRLRVDWCEREIAVRDGYLRRCVAPTSLS